MRFNTLIVALLTMLPALQGYGADKIPECLLNYKYGTEQFFLIAEKSSQTLSVYSNYSPEPVEKIKITTGRMPGRKEYEGDMKTPEGIYFFTRILSGEELPKVDDYGDRAFIMSYPNPVDRKDKRNGSGIWLHGAFNPQKTSNPNNSRGCVVMSNKDLLKISKYIFLNITPICIYDRIRYETPDKIRKKRETFINRIRDWKTSWESKDIDRYMDFYSRDFSYRKMNLSEFRNYKNRLNRIYAFISVFLSDVNVYAYRNHYVARFNQLYVSDKNHFYSKKIQYWEQGNKDPRIMDEKTINLPAISTYEFTKGNTLPIDEFRKNHWASLNATNFDYQPSGVSLDSISAFDNRVELRISNRDSGKGIRIIPVLLLKDKQNTNYQTLDNIRLKNGIPADYTGSIPLNNKNTSVTIALTKGYQIRSLTIFTVNRSDKLEQIVTYFVNK